MGASSETAKEGDTPLRTCLPLRGALFAGLALCACAPSTAIPVSYQRYTYTCCAASDIQRAWHPGDTFSLHWAIQDAGTSPAGSGLSITLTAVLTGPYANVSALKAGSAHTVTLSAAPIVISDESNGRPVSTIVLPSTMPVGLYNLVERIGLGPDYAQSSGSIIQVFPSSH